MDKRLHGGPALTQDREQGGVVVASYRGFVLVAEEESEDEWHCVKIVIDAASEIEWPLPALVFPTEGQAFDHMRAIVDVAYPQETGGERQTELTEERSE